MLRQMLLPHQNAIWRHARRLFHRQAATSQDGAQIPYRGEDLVVPIRTLSIVGPLLVFNDFLVLAENVFGKPGHEGPYGVDNSRKTRLLHRQITVSAIATLLCIERRVAQPYIENRFVGLFDVPANPYP